MKTEWLGSGRALSAEVRRRLDAGAASPLDGLRWFEDFSDTVRLDGVPDWLLVTDDSASLLLPMMIETRRRALLRWRTLRSLSNWYSMRWRPLAGAALADDAASMAPGSPWTARAWDAVAGALRARGLPRVVLEPVPEAEDWLSTAARALERAGFRVRQEEAFGNWVGHAEGLDFEAWFARRPSQVRNTWRRRRAQLARQGRMDIRILDGRQDGPQDVEAALDAYERVYARSWKPVESDPAFVRALARRAATQGALRLGVLEMDGTPVAAQLWLRDGDSTLIYKLAYDEAWKPFSPGLALTVEMFRHAIDVDRARRLDFGSGDDPYKRDWMDERRRCVRLVADDPRHPLGLLLAARESWRHRRSL